VLPGVVMMKTVSPGKTRPSLRACSSSQATLPASPICACRSLMCSRSAALAVVRDRSLVSSAWPWAASLKTAYAASPQAAASPATTGRRAGLGLDARR